MLTSLANLTNAGIFTVEASHEHGGLASRIHLIVDGTDFEDCSRSWSNLNVYESSPVLH